MEGEWNLFRDGIASKQASAWIAAALIPVLTQLIGGESWVYLLGAGAVTVLVTWIVLRYGAREYPRWLCAAQMIYTTVLLGQLLDKAAGSWPTGHPIAVPLIVLALAAWSAQKGLSAGARVGTVLFWFVIIMYLAFFGAGVREVELKWLVPRWRIGELWGLVLLLLPAGAVVLLRKNEKWELRLTLPAIFAVLSAVIAAGVLSPSAAQTADNPIYELSRSLSLFGIAKRFEVVISAGMTVGWFALISLLLSMIGKYFSGILNGKGRIGVWSAAITAAIFLLCGLHIPWWGLAVGATVFWVVAPILTQGVGSQKKS